MALGQYSKGIEYLERALRINRRIGKRKHEGDALNNLALRRLEWINEGA
jgi:tetratricopeptide (TPR) repeat protein